MVFLKREKLLKNKMKLKTEIVSVYKSFHDILYTRVVKPVYTYAGIQVYAFSIAMHCCIHISNVKNHTL